MTLTLTIRYIKSFEYNIVKYLVLSNIETSTTIGDLKTLAIEQLSSNPSLKRMVNHTYDSFKIYHKPGWNKSSNRVINTDHDEYILKDNDKTLAEYNIEDEFELSFFSMSEYCTFLRGL